MINEAILKFEIFIKKRWFKNKFSKVFLQSKCISQVYLASFLHKIRRINVCTSVILSACVQEIILWIREILAPCIRELGKCNYFQNERIQYIFSCNSQ